MADLTSYTRELDEAQVEVLREALEEENYEFHEKDHVLYAAKKGKVNVSVYQKGPKVLVQGKGTEDFVRFLLEPRVIGVAELGYEEENHPEMFEEHVGIDESGKGDFFGPLVVVGALVAPVSARALLDLGVCDSKRIGSDKRIRDLAAAIRGLEAFDHELILLRPSKYNELHQSMGNVNRLLAWGHARVLENLLERHPSCPRALSDQFARAEVLQRALGERGRTIEVEQRPRAESDLAVAAASILAREAFIDWIDKASEHFGIELPRGASSAVKEAAGKMIQGHGEADLDKICKVHFKTRNEISDSFLP